ncbi:MAG: magnesium transporter [Caldilineaceae bacterium]|nr:magnesium transporter [Caldilineaceae bacterium]
MVDPINLTDVASYVLSLIEQNKLDEAAAYLRGLHPADSAEIITNLDADEQAAVVERFDPPELAQVFSQMHEEDMLDVAQHLDVEALAEVLDEMEPDTAADLLGELEPQAAAELIEQMDEAAPVVSLMAYDEESAGGIMNTPPASLRRWMTVTEAFTFIKQNYHDENEIFYLYVIDRFGRLFGVVNLRALILADPYQTIEEIMNRDVVSVRTDVDQEEVAQVLARYDLLAVPVVDDTERLVGIIAHDDIVDVLEEEATEDIYRLAQVGEDAEIFSSVPRAIRNRLPWLVINMGTAFLASSVVAYFQGTIAQVAVLAAFMPIVAGQGGNAGTQTMTIMVRSLALGELQGRDTWLALWHEFRIGLIHGIVLGILVGLTAWAWQRNPMLGAIIGLAMLGNLIVAALAGVLVPMLLKLLRVDPALASGVFVTTATDALGFSLFLGLATYFIRWLL